MDEVVIRSQRELEAWLKARPEATRRDEAIAIAHRAALRVLPLAMLDSNWFYALKNAYYSIQERQLDVSFGWVSRELAGENNAIDDAGFAGFKAVSAAQSFSSDQVVLSVALAVAYAARSVDKLRPPDGASGQAHLFPPHSVSFWEEVSHDAQIIENGASLLNTKLWDRSPYWFRRYWRELEATSESRGGQKVWSFWTRWFEAAVGGNPLPWDLQRDVALIEDEIWMTGPEAVAKAIEEIEHGWENKVPKPTLAKTERLLAASLSRFTFDEIRRLMKMVPFEEDLKYLRDPKRLNAFLDDAELLRDKIETLQVAFQREGRVLQGAQIIATYLERINDEFSRSRQLQTLRVGWIIDLSDILQTASLDREVRQVIGPIGNKALAGIVDELKSITVTHFSATIMRFAPLKDIRSGEETSLRDLLEDLRRGFEQIRGADPEKQAPLAPEDIVVIDSLIEDVERMIRAEFFAPTPEEKGALRKEIDFRIAQVTVTLLLLKRDAKRYGKDAMSAMRLLGDIDAAKGALEKLIEWLSDK